MKTRNKIHAKIAPSFSLRLFFIGFLLLIIYIFFVDFTNCKFFLRFTIYAITFQVPDFVSISFCYNRRSAALKDEIDFFQRRLGSSRALEQLLTLRHTYTPSFLFVARCMPALVRLHLRTALDNSFRRETTGN